MKVVVITSLIVILFFIGAFVAHQYIDKSCEKLISIISDLDKSIENEDWPQSEIQIKRLKEQWNETKKSWQLFLEHHEIDAIDVSLGKVKRYIDVEERILTLGEITQLKFFLDRIAEREVLKLSNIF